MKKFLHVLSVVFACVALPSCEDLINVDLRTAELQPVIEGSVRLNAFPEVRITTTKSFADTTAYVPVSDAIVELSDDAGHREVLQYDPVSGIYRGKNENLKGVERRRYLLSVTQEDRVYVARSSMPPLVSMDSLTLRTIPQLDYPCPVVNFTDPRGEENDCYRYLIYINGRRFKSDELLLSAELLDGSAIHQMAFLFPEEGSNLDPVKPGDEITVEMQCVDRDTFEFFTTLSNVDRGLANPVSNISGGALGYFGAYSMDRKSVTIPGGHVSP